MSNEDELIARLTHAVEGLRSKVYVSRSTMAQLLLDIDEFCRTEKLLVTPEMVREAEAHFPFALKDATKYEQWQWFADFYTNAILEPDKPCHCCNVTPAGDIADEVQMPLLTESPGDRL
jgi:hypothetical protein